MASDPGDGVNSIITPASQRFQAKGVILSRRNTTLVYRSCPLCLRKLVPIVQQDGSNSVRKSLCWRCKIEFEEQELVLCYHLLLEVSDGRFVTEVPMIGSCLDSVFGLPARQFVRLVPNFECAAAALDKVVAGRQILLHFRVKNPPHQLLTLQQSTPEGTVPLSSLFSCFSTSRSLVPTSIEFTDRRRTNVASELFRMNCEVAVDPQLSNTCARQLLASEPTNAPLHSNPSLAQLSRVDTKKLSVNAMATDDTAPTQCRHMPIPISNRNPFNTEEANCSDDGVCFGASTSFSQLCPAYASQSVIFTQSGAKLNFDFNNDTCLSSCTCVNESSCLSGSSNTRFNLEGSCSTPGREDHSDEKSDILDAMLYCWSPMETESSGLEQNLYNQSAISRSSLSPSSQCTPQKSASCFLSNVSSKECLASHTLSTGSPSLPSGCRGNTESFSHGHSTTVQTRPSPIRTCTEAREGIWDHSDKFLPVDSVDCKRNDCHSQGSSCGLLSVSVPTRFSTEANLAKGTVTTDQTAPVDWTGHQRNARADEGLQQSLRASSLQQLDKFDSSNTTTLDCSDCMEDALCLLNFDDFDDASISDQIPSRNVSLGDPESTQPIPAAGLSPSLFTPSPLVGSAGSRSLFHALSSLVPETDHRHLCRRRLSNTRLPYSPCSPDLFAYTPSPRRPPRGIATSLTWLSPDIL